jgi:hypothetical protein
MIYSRFGTKLTPLSKRQDTDGRISIQATAEGAEGVRDYALAELTADEGLNEIRDAVEKLAWRNADTAAPSRGKLKRGRIV